METGTVLEVRGDIVTWRCERTGEVHTDRLSDVEKIHTTVVNNRLESKQQISPSGVKYTITRRRR